MNADTVIALVLLGGGAIGLGWTVADWFYARADAKASPGPTVGVVDPTDYCQVVGCKYLWQADVWGWRLCVDHLPSDLYKEPVE